MLQKFYCINRIIYTQLYSVKAGTIALLVLSILNIINYSVSHKDPKQNQTYLPAFFSYNITLIHRIVQNENGDLQLV